MKDYPKITLKQRFKQWLLSTFFSEELKKIHNATGMNPYWESNCTNEEKTSYCAQWKMIVRVHSLLWFNKDVEIYEKIKPVEPINYDI